jgi:hypothetical protein
MNKGFGLLLWFLVFTGCKTFAQVTFSNGVITMDNGTILSGGTVIIQATAQANVTIEDDNGNHIFKFRNDPAVTVTYTVPVMCQWGNTTIVETAPGTGGAVPVTNNPESTQIHGGTISHVAGSNTWTITLAGLVTINKGSTTIPNGSMWVGGDHDANVPASNDETYINGGLTQWLRSRLEARYKGRVYRTPFFALTQRYGVARLGQFTDSKGTEFWSHFDATQRSATTFVHNGRIHVLSEVPPDAAVQTLTSVVAKLNVKNTVTADFSLQTAKTIAELGQRTALVNMQRDALFRLSEYDYNHTTDGTPGLSQDNFRYLYNRVITEAFDAHKVQSESATKLADIEFKRDSLSSKLAKAQSDLKTASSKADSIQKQFNDYRIKALCCCVSQAKDTTGSSKAGTGKQTSSASDSTGTCPCADCLKSLLQDGSSQGSSSAASSSTLKAAAKKSKTAQ